MEYARSILKTNHRTKNLPGTMGYSKVELDSRADTCCAGADFTIIEHTGTTCEVHPYHPKYKPVTNVPVVKAVNPNQIRSNGVIVDDCPTHLSPNKSSTHSIYFPEHDVKIPLQLNGIISYISIRKPTQLEIETCTWLELTSDDDWDPYAPSFEENEDKYQSVNIHSVNRQLSPLPNYGELEYKPLKRQYQPPPKKSYDLLSTLSKGDIEPCSSNCDIDN